MSRPTLLLTILLSGALSVRAEIMVGTERAISDVRFGAPSGAQRPEAIATDGTRFLVLWSDGAPRPGLYASIVTGPGRQPAGHVIRRLGTVRNVAVVWTGNNYLAVWSDDAAGAAMTAIISAEGTLVGEPRVLSSMRMIWARSLAWNGRHALLAYLPQSSTVLSIAILGGDGAVISARPLAENGLNGNVRVSSSGSEFAVLFSARPMTALTTPPPPAQPSPLIIVRISDDGSSVPGSPPVVTVVLSGTRYDIAGSAEGYAVLANTAQFGGTAVVRRFLVDRATLQATELATLTAADTYDVNVLWNGARFIAYWMAYTSTSFALQKADYAHDTIETVAQGNSLAVLPLVATNGQSALAVWMGGAKGAISAGGGDVVGLFAGPDITTDQQVAPFLIGINGLHQSPPRIAASARGSLVVWTEGMDLSKRLYAARVLPSGAVLDQEPIVVATDIEGSYSAAAVGASYLVTWIQAEGGASGAYVRSIASDGAPGAPRRLGPAFSTEIASNGALALVATSSSTLAAFRVTESGAVLDASPISIAGNGSYLKSVASNGSDFLVVWNEGSDHWQFGSPDLVDVYAARVFANGAADAGKIAIATGPSDQKNGLAASSGGDYLIAYFSDGDPAFRGTPRIMAKRLSSTGQLVESTAVDAGHVVADRAVDFAMTAAGSGYAIVSEAQDGGGLSAVVRITDLSGRVTATATVATTDGPAMGPAIGSIGPLIRVVYIRRAVDAGDTMRLFLRDIAAAVPRRRATVH